MGEGYRSAAKAFSEGKDKLGEESPIFGDFLRELHRSGGESGQVKLEHRPPSEESTPQRLCQRMAGSFGAGLPECRKEAQALQKPPEEHPEDVWTMLAFRDTEVRKQGNRSPGSRTEKPPHRNPFRDGTKQEGETEVPGVKPEGMPVRTKKALPGLRVHQAAGIFEISLDSSDYSAYSLH
jgi:hypothetical protein